MDQSLLKENNKLALFDFDGTLTRYDTMFSFIEYTKGRSQLVMSLLALSPMLVMTKLGLVPAEKAKKRLLKYHFDGAPQAELQAKANEFCADMLPKLFRDEALEKLHFHRSKGHVVYIVSASLELWVKPWLDTQGLPGICTKPVWVDGKFVADFDGPNCNGPEKARRIKEVIDLKSFDRIYAYGDSKGDTEMLALAHRRFFRKFV